MLAKYPFIVGFVVSALLAFIFIHLQFGMLSTIQVRGIGMLVHGGVLIILFRQGLDRDDVFWYFLGAVAGFLVSFFLSIEIPSSH